MSEHVYWLYTGRGGYADLSYHAAAVVLSRTAKRVRIAVYNLRSKQVQYKNVTPDRISPRSEASLPLDEIVKACQAQEATR